jgi:HK97 gp10 family phage protein
VSKFVKLQGMEELLERVGRLATPTKVRNTLKLAMKKALKPTHERVIAMAPRGKRRRSDKPLHQSIIIYDPPPRKGAEMRVMANSPHAHLLEFGTVKMSARPFIRPAWDQTQGEALKIYRKELERLLLKEGV